jgi:Chaperonin GroEL (HSP60 family)
MKWSDERNDLEFLLNMGPAIVFNFKASVGLPVEYISNNVIQFGYPAEEFIDARMDVSRCVIGNRPIVYDCAAVKKYALIAATETVVNILRVDEILPKK